MGRLDRKLLGVVLAGTLPIAARAQVSLDLGSTDTSTTTAALGGTASIDIITLRGNGPSAPLRYGNVVQGSERVELGGRTLVASQDYAMDYGTGVVYLCLSVREGDVLTVSYRYTKSTDTSAAKRYSGIAGFKYTLVPGGLNMMMGLGLTERAADGTVLSSNTFGFNNSTKFGGGVSKGLFLYGQRQKDQVSSGMRMNADDKAGDAATDEGDSSLILQNYSTKAMGGQVSVDYQNVSKNFTSFANASDAGYDDGSVNKLKKERGLTRFGYGLKDLQLGGLGFSNSFRNVKDDSGSIEWQNYGVDKGGFKLNLNTQRVDQGFTRFTDIAEGDRDQLAKERGMNRQNFTGEYAQKFGKLGFESSAIKDESSGKAIERRKVHLDTASVKFELGDQDVDSGFGRFDSLMGSEKAMWGLEAGIHRQWSSLQTSLFGSKTPLSFNQTLLTSGAGSFRSQDVAMQGKTWSIQRSSRAIDSTFGSMAAMGNDEIGGHLQAIAAMYGQGTNVGGNDRNILLQEHGISREYTSVQTRLFPGWNLAVNQLDFKGATDGGSVQNASLGGKSFNATYRHQELGKQFSEVTSLMEFERQRLGTVAGLDRTDLGMNFSLGGAKKLALTNMKAALGDAGLSRSTLAYTDKRIDIQVNSREVDPAMSVANQLVDSEKDILQALSGFKQRDVRVKWEILPNLKADMFEYDAANQTTDEDRKNRQVALDWAPNKTTGVSYFKSEQKSSNPTAELFASVVERISITKGLGRLGNFKFLDESQSLGGDTSTDPGHHTQYMSFETQINPQTSLKTEQTRTDYDNGDKENTSANTISTNVTKNAGVSLTDVSVDRSGDQRDEKKRNYGFWLDLGHGLRVSYGYARQLNGDQSNLTNAFTVGSNAGSQKADQVNQVQQSQVGDFSVGGGYGSNSWDASGRTQSYSNVSVTSAKPMRFGLLKDLKFAFSYDTAADYTAWLRENRYVAVTGNFLGNVMGFEYKGQMNPTGDRGVDRAFKFETPQNDKNWLRASINYKARTLPNDQQVMIRDFKVAVKPSRSIELSTQLFTNREVAKGDALLGSITEADRTNMWSVDWKRSPNFTLSGSWKEALNDQVHSLARTAGLTFKFNEMKGSPVSLFYGLEQQDGNVERRSRHRYYVQFDQKSGPNQMFSLFFGDINYQTSIPTGESRSNLTVRLDFQLRF